ncbi:hypothetical protein ASZ90_001104 [hydrocarbon metagenome]|uniref:Uncharacterized protein n=1 Tax=hydrocarbon metagenome TaxID=938273 RepID=A0A0W8G7D3_9ZZZZ
MESVLRDILAAQKEMLAELRQIRVLLAERGQLSPEPAAYLEAPDDIPPGPDPAEFTLEPEAPPSDPPPSDPPPLAPASFSPSDLKDLGQSFATPRTGKSRPGMVDVSDLRGSLLDEIKGKNRAKSRAFSEFSKYRRDE